MTAGKRTLNGKAVSFAEELGLRHENRPCGTNNLARFLNRARELARVSAEKAQ